MELKFVFYIIGALTGFPAIVITLIQCLLHLRNYSEPLFQRYILRILFMIPLYCITSYLSLVVTQWSLIFDTIRDCYEAWVIYNFLSLCFAYGGGPGEIVRQAQEKDLGIRSSFFLCTCCLPSMSVNGGFLRRVKQGTLQFVFIKPVLAVLTLILNYGFNRYHEGDYNPKYGYLYIQIIYNICYTIALYSLLLFYIGTESLLAPFKPFLKFVIVKAVVFFTFWQGFLISCLQFGGALKEKPLNPKQLQSFLLCVEMFISAILMLFAFPHQDFTNQVDASKRIQMQQQGTNNERKNILHAMNMGDLVTKERRKNIFHAMNMGDLMTDTVHHMNPRYKEYVQYTDQENIHQGKGQKNSNKGSSPNLDILGGTENQNYTKQPIQSQNQNQNLDLLTANSTPLHQIVQKNRNYGNDKQKDDIEANKNGVEALHPYGQQGYHEDSVIGPQVNQQDRDIQLKNQYQMQRNQRPQKQFLPNQSTKNENLIKQYKNREIDEDKNLFG